MRAIILLLALISSPTKAQDCLSESETFFGLVATKWAVTAGIKNAPGSFRGDKWLYIWGGSSSTFKKKKISEERAKSMARLVADNDFSRNPEVEVNIFEDYWYLSCELNKKGEGVIPLEDIAKDHLIDCWNTVSSREEFQGCLLPLVNKS